MIRLSIPLLQICVLSCAIVGTVSSVDCEESGDYIHFRLGVKYKREQKHDLAIEEFRKVLSAYPDNYNAYMHLAEIRKAQGRPRLVIYNLKKALAYNPGWGRAHKLLAEAYESDRQFQKAIMELQLYQQTCDPAERDEVQKKISALIQKVTGKAPQTQSESSTSTGQKARTDDTPQKKSASRKAIERDPVEKALEGYKPPAGPKPKSRAEKAFEEGVRLYSERDFSGSIAQLRRCLSLQPGHPGAYYYAGLIRRRKGQNDMAKINFSRAIAYPEMGYNAHFYLGKIYGEDKEFGKGIFHLKKYLAQTDYEAGKEEARDLIAKYELALRQVSDTVTVVDVKSIAREDLKKEVGAVKPPVPLAPLEVSIDSLLSMVIVDTLTDPGQAMLIGVRKFLDGEYDNAIKAFKNAQADYPTSNVGVHCMYNIGICYLKLRLFDNALNQFEQVLSRYGKHKLAAQSLFLRALSFLEKGESQSAQKYFRLFIRKHSGHAWKPKAFEKLGDAYLDLEQQRKAIDAFLQAAKIARNDRDKIYALFKAGNAYTEISNPSRAIDAFQSIIDIGKKRSIYVRVPDSYYKIADHYYREKKYDLSLKYYNDVTRAYPRFQETPWGLFQMGNIYKQQKKFDKAVKMYQQVLSDYPQDYWARQARWKMEDARWEHEYKNVFK
ncbi:MAG: tetratricopeptide repeat protein [Chitinivibrionales bacterium]|nr:tetratricopeptide repeat protein [Chitinivibrionales bacterium]